MRDKMTRSVTGNQNTIPHRVQGRSIIQGRRATRVVFRKLERGVYRGKKAAARTGQGWLSISSRGPRSAILLWRAASPTLGHAT